MQIKVFISHASANKEIAEKLAKAIKNGFLLNSTEIICTSVEGLGLPCSKDDFYGQLKKAIEEAFVVIYLISEEFCRSEDCLYELAWGKGKDSQIYFHLESARSTQKPQLLKLTNMLIMDDAGISTLATALRNGLHKEKDDFEWTTHTQLAIRETKKYQREKEILRLSLEIDTQIKDLQKYLEKISPDK